MSVRISSKEILAKLMATENIIVEHANVPTAGFDLINRKLLLPNWKDISDTVYTLLISHEVGHALHTPREEWEDAVMTNPNKELKGVINIVEDVRIEKLIQQQFPGTIRSFKAGYDELEKMNLFGTVGSNIKEYGLLDRLNIHFKVGHFGYVNVPFSDAEKPWLAKVGGCKSFADVVSVAQELLQYVKDNPESQGKNSPNKQDSDIGEATIGELTDDENAQPASEDDLKNLAGIKDPKNLLGDLPPPTDKDQDESSSPFSIRTQEHFDSSLQKFVDKSVTKTTYVSLPKIILERIIVPYKTVHAQISDYYKTYYPGLYAEAEVKLQPFKTSSKTVVNQMANLFEMKKKARLDVKALTTHTGVLNTNKIHAYRYSEDIFKKLTTVPMGKSHGLVMFIDLSSSMSDCLAATFQQLLNLVLFCRRVNIPFDVYGFSDSYAAGEGLENRHFSPGELCFEKRYCLRQYFSNTMSGNEFNNAIKNVLCLVRAYATNGSYMGVPRQEQLNCTPLNAAIITAIKIVNNFREQYRLDVVNTVFLTDGEDNHGLDYVGDSGIVMSMDVKSKWYNSYFAANAQKNRAFIKDPVSKKQWEIKNSTQDLLEIFKEMTGSKAIGFYLCRRSEAQHKIEELAHPNENADAMYEKFKETKFCEFLNRLGYDAYYIVPHGKHLNITSDKYEGEFDASVNWDDEKASKKAMKSVQKEFTSSMKEIVLSRVLLNKFIDHIT